MRLILLSLLVVSFFPSCVYYQSYPNLQDNHLTTMSFSPHEKDLELFFTGESQPQRDYLRIAMVKETRRAYMASPGKLLKSLQRQAREVGADAILIMGIENSEEILTNCEDETYSVPRENMWGIAIKYVDQLDFDDNIISHLTVTPQGDFADEQEGIVDLNSNGDLDEEPSTYWANYVYDRSLEYLLKSEKNWHHTRTAATDTDYDHNLLRKQMKGTTVWARLKAEVGKDEKIRRLVITYLRGVYVFERMKISFDSDGRVNAREWVNRGGDRVFTELIYDGKGVLQQEIYQMKKKGGELQPLLSVQYHYFTKEAILAQLEEEQIIRVNP